MMKAFHIIFYYNERNIEWGIRKINRILYGKSKGKISPFIGH